MIIFRSNFTHTRFSTRNLFNQLVFHSSSNRLFCTFGMWPYEGLSIQFSFRLLVVFRKQGQISESDIVIAASMATWLFYLSRDRVVSLNHTHKTKLKFPPKFSLYILIYHTFAVDGGVFVMREWLQYICIFWKEWDDEMRHGSRPGTLSRS